MRLPVSCGVPNRAVTNPTPALAESDDSGIGELAEPTQSARKRLTGEERRDQIIDAAIPLFGRHGYNGTTTKALAEAAGVSEATIFKHFPTKDALHAAAFDRRARVGSDELMVQLQALADRGEDEALLKTVVAGIFKGLEQDSDMQRMLLFAWLEQSPEENQRLWSSLQEYPLFPFLDRWVARRQAEGQFVAGAPDLLRGAVAGLAVNYATRHKLYGLPAEHDDETVTALLAAFLLRGLRKPSASD